MTAFLDLITFFGLASFFAWLGYVPLQKDLLDKFTGTDHETARDNFYTINDYFLVSFLFYSAAIVSEYFLHTISIGIDKNPLYGSSLLVFIIGTCFLGGLVTLAAPIWYIRKIGKGETDLVTVTLHKFDYSLLVSGCATLDVVVSVSSFVAFLNPKTYDLTSPLGYFWLACIGFALFGVVLTMNYFDGDKRQALGWILLSIPVIAKIVIAFLQ